MPTPKPLTRSQTRRLPKEATVEEFQGEAMEKSPRHGNESPLQHNDEEMPHEEEILDHRDNSTTNIIKVTDIDKKVTG